MAPGANFHRRIRRFEMKVLMNGNIEQEACGHQKLEKSVAVCGPSQF
jgi:hypothetical protein